MVICRPMVQSDIASVAQIYRELQAFNGYELESITALVERIGSAPPSFEWMIAESDRTIRGFALFSVFPGAALKPAVFLKELFVTEQSRGHMIGKRLMEGLARLARERGCERIDLTTSTTNLRARSLYENLGGRDDPAKIFYRFDGKAIEMMANSEK